MGFKSTVQTSNIGQFGESKSGLEIREALDMVKLNYRDTLPLVVAMVDGAGFYSNTAGLNEILQSSDEFCQFGSLWKAAVIVASVQNVKLDLVLQDTENHSEFLERFGRTLNLTTTKDRTGWIQAGEGWVRRHSKSN